MNIPLYNKLKFEGKMLNEGFSIYLYTIKRKNTEEKFFYLGMTGDNFYPSARSFLHRMAGHFEKKKRSTQNMIMKCLEKNNISDYSNLEFEIYHWPITSFKPWGAPLRDFKKADLVSPETEQYDNYKERQSQVLKLEQHLIHKLIEFHRDSCLNKAISRESDKTLPEFDPIIDEVMKLISHR